jgi:transcriptional regulator with XRE-family HTH domain
MHTLSAKVSPEGREKPEVVLAANLSALMDFHGENQTAVAKRAKIPQQQVSRALRATHSVTLATLEALARGYELRAYQLLVPGLDPRNPQTLPVTVEERAFYARLQEVARQFAKPSEANGADDRPSPHRARPPVKP